MSEWLAGGTLVLAPVAAVHFGRRPYRTSDPCVLVLEFDPADVFSACTQYPTTNAHRVTALTGAGISFSGSSFRIILD